MRFGARGAKPVRMDTIDRSSQNGISSRSCEVEVFNLFHHGC